MGRCFNNNLLMTPCNGNTNNPVSMIMICVICCTNILGLNTNIPHTS